MFVLNFRPWIGRLRHPGSAAPPNRPRLSRHSTRGSNMVVPCTCNTHRDCAPPLRAARDHAMVPKTSPCKNQQSTVPARLFPAPPAPRRSQDCFTCVGCAVAADQTRPAAQTGQAASTAVSNLKMEGITSVPLEGARRAAQLRAAKIKRGAQYLSTAHRPGAPAAPLPPPMGPSLHRKLAAFSGSSHTF